MFGIVAQQRSGTHFLGSLLSSHPHVISLGEEIIASKGTRNNFYTYLGAQAASNPDAIRPPNLPEIWRGFVGFLAQQYPDVRQLGVIIMYNQLELLPPPLAERILAEVRIIHLIRRNVLRTHISDYINRNTDKPAHSELQGELVQVKLPSDTLLEELRARVRRIEAMRQVVSRYRHIEISYEELLNCREEALRRLQGYLKIAPAPLSTALQPSNPWPLEDILLNYSDAQAALRGSEFAAMIETTANQTLPEQPSASVQTVEPTSPIGSNAQPLPLQPRMNLPAITKRHADQRAAILPLRIEVGALLDRTLRLEESLAAARERAGWPVLKRVARLISALRRTRSLPGSEKRDRHFVRCATVLLKSGLFDSEYYLRRNPDVAAAGIEPVAHYIRWGAAELRSPSPYFSTRWYVEQYPDVLESEKNPLYHFIVSGYAEGRLPQPVSVAALSATDAEQELNHAAPVFGPIRPVEPRRTIAATKGEPADGIIDINAPANCATRSRARLVVYTALFGDYDELFLPSRAQAQRCDFVVFTDQPNVPPPWRRGYVDFAGPDDSRRNRFYKLLPHRLFPQYEWSLYLDSNIDLRSDPIAFLDRYCDLGADFLLFRHPSRTSIAEELAACIEKRKDDAVLMVRQVARYLDSGFRHDFPLTENNVLLRRHNARDLVDLNETWWEEVRSSSGRDQLSLSYVIETKRCHRIALFEGGNVTVRNSPDFRLRPHRQRFYLADALDDPAY